MRILITGGAGFIGGHLADALFAQSHHSIVAVDNLSTGSLKNVERFAGNQDFKLIVDDILTMENLEKLIVNSDVIYHLAAAVGVELVVHNPVQTLMTNVHGTSRVLEIAAKHRIRTIIASTSEVYGKSKKCNFEETDDLVIGSPMRSRWSYACSKLIDEFFLMAYVRNFGFPGTVVRFFNTVGPGQTGKFGMVIPRFVESALKNEPIRVFGSGAQTRCFCHVFDTVRALVGLADNRESYGEIYNIGSKRVISMLELAELVKRELNSSSAIELVPYEKAYAKGFEDMLKRSPSTEKIQELLNWQPKHTLEEIIQDTADWLRATC